MKPLSDGDPTYLNVPGVAVVTWNQDLKAACLEMQGWASTSEARDTLEAILRAMVEHRGSRWLTDARNMKVIKQSDQDWITQNWLPRAAAAGLKRAAIVLPTSMVAMTNVEDVAKVSDNGIDTRFFATMEKAAEWLTALRPAA